MFVNILIGCVLLIATTVVHASAMVIGLREFRVARKRGWAERTIGGRAIAVSFLVVLMFLASVVEAIMWAVTYLLLGAIKGTEQAMYFSMVTYTTLGYGDVLPVSQQAKSLALVEAVVGQLYLAVLIGKLVGMYAGSGGRR